MSLKGFAPTALHCLICGARILHGDNRSPVRGDALCGPSRAADQRLVDRTRHDRAVALSYRQGPDR